MNCVLRVRTDRRSFILKQSRPWVEKYSAIAAPWDRTLVEAQFYQAVAGVPDLARRMPTFLGLDPQSRTLALEDIGETKDFVDLYAGVRLTPDQLDELATYLAGLHARFDAAQQGSRFANRAMRALNHEHIFDLPLRPDNGLDLDRITPGLSTVAGALKRDRPYVDTVADLGARYLRDGPVLLHGDYFPGSWLRTAEAVKVIDPEFCFVGPREFDLGFMLAHLALAQQPAALSTRLADRYGRSDFDRDLAVQYAGVEIMRRLIGVAQLPLGYGLSTKASLLTRSTRMILEPSTEEVP